MTASLFCVRLLIVIPSCKNAWLFVFPYSILPSTISRLSPDAHVDRSGLPLRTIVFVAWVTVNIVAVASLVTFLRVSPLMTVSSFESSL